MSDHNRATKQAQTGANFFVAATRQPTLEQTDLLIIGGGINGAGIALDAIGRGLSVRVVEQNDFASATSSNSSKLIHGGLRYLEHYEFRLVKEALAEREVLLNKAPHLVKPLRFILPHESHLRPAWMIRCGLFLYDHLGGKSSLEKSTSVSFKPDNPLKTDLGKGFEFTDCWVDDARLVTCNLLEVRKRGGIVSNYTQCEQAKPDKNGWLATLLDVPTGQRYQVRARCLVNATGPWAQQFLEEKVLIKSSRRLRLIKGSHLIVPRVYTGSHAYILQNEDKRIVFVIPYLENFTIIGTTDTEHYGAPETVAIDSGETAYLLKVFNSHFKKQLSEKDIVSTYSGVRPLCDDESNNPSAVTRDYTISLEQPSPGAPLLNIFGGKLTTYRKLAEAALAQLTDIFPDMQRPWTQGTALPGGELDRSAVRVEMAKRIPFVPNETRERWVNSYGTLYRHIARSPQSFEDYGRDLGDGLTTAEVDYLIRSEWARTPEDILKRRTKLYLNGKDLAASVLSYLKEQDKDQKTASRGKS